MTICVMLGVWLGGIRHEPSAPSRDFEHERKTSVVHRSTATTVVHQSWIAQRSGESISRIRTLPKSRDKPSLLCQSSEQTIEYITWGISVLPCRTLRRVTRINAHLNDFPVQQTFVSLPNWRYRDATDRFRCRDSRSHSDRATAAADFRRNWKTRQDAGVASRLPAAGRWCVRMVANGIASGGGQ